MIQSKIARHRGTTSKVNKTLPPLFEIHRRQPRLLVRVHVKVVLSSHLIVLQVGVEEPWVVVGPVGRSGGSGFAGGWVGRRRRDDGLFGFSLDRFEKRIMGSGSDFRRTRKSGEGRKELTASAACLANTCSYVHTLMPVIEWSNGCEIPRINCLDRASAMSVDSFECDSVMYWLIHFGNFARLSARANRCIIGWGPERRSVD